MIRDQTGKEVTATDRVFIRLLPAQVQLIPAEHRDDLRPEPRTVGQIRVGDLIAEGGQRGEAVTELRYVSNDRRGSMLTFSTRDVASGSANSFTLAVADEVAVVPRERRLAQDVAPLFGRPSGHDQVASEVRRTYDLHAAVADVTGRVWPNGNGPQDEVRALNAAIGAIDSARRGVDGYRANAAAMEAAAAAAAALFAATDDDLLYRYVGLYLYRLLQHLDAQAHRLNASAAHLDERAAADAPAADASITSATPPAAAVSPDDADREVETEEAPDQVPDGQMTAEPPITFATPPMSLKDQPESLAQSEQRFGSPERLALYAERADIVRTSMATSTVWLDGRLIGYVEDLNNVVGAAHDLSWPEELRRPPGPRFESRPTFGHRDSVSALFEDDRAAVAELVARALQVSVPREAIDPDTAWTLDVKLGTIRVPSAYAGDDQDGAERLSALQQVVANLSAGQLTSADLADDLALAHDGLLWASDLTNTSGPYMARAAEELAVLLAATRPDDSRAWRPGPYVPPPAGVEQSANASAAGQLGLFGDATPEADRAPAAAEPPVGEPPAAVVPPGGDADQVPGTEPTDTVLADTAAAAESPSGGDGAVVLNEEQQDYIRSQDRNIIRGQSQGLHWIDSGAVPWSPSEGIQLPEEDRFASKMRVDWAGANGLAHVVQDDSQGRLTLTERGRAWMALADAMLSAPEPAAQDHPDGSKRLTDSERETMRKATEPRRMANNLHAVDAGHVTLTQRGLTQRRVKFRKGASIDERGFNWANSAGFIYVAYYGNRQRVELTDRGREVMDLLDSVSREENQGVERAVQRGGTLPPLVDGPGMEPEPVTGSAPGPQAGHAAASEPEAPVAEAARLQGPPYGFGGQAPAPQDPSIEEPAAPAGTPPIGPGEPAPADMTLDQLADAIDSLHGRLAPLSGSEDPLDLAMRRRLELRLFACEEEERFRWQREPEYDENGKVVPPSRTSVILDRLTGYGLNNTGEQGLVSRVEDLPDAKPGACSDEEWARIDATASAREAFPPTDEQRITIEGAARRRLNMAVMALAGSGKSTLLKMLSHRMPDASIVYLAFNKSVAAEARAAQARGEYAQNLIASTANAYASRVSDRRLNDRLPSSRAGGFKKLGAQQIADRMRWYHTVRAGGRDITPGGAAAVAERMIRAWAKSADTDLGPQHVPGGSEQERRGLYNAVKPLADRMWANLTDPEAGDPDRDLTMDFDYIVKMWALGGYKLGADVLFWDEAQDVNPVMEGVVRAALDQGVQVVAVGDSNQAIYGFRGASDALAKLPVDARATLTKSFRFGPGIADTGNRFLRLLGTRMRLEGNDGRQSQIAELQPGEESMVIARTNAGVALAAVQALTSGRSVAVSGGVKDLQEFVQAARALAAGEDTGHAELARFNGEPFEDIVEQVNNDPDLQQLASLFNLLKKHSDAIDALLVSGARPAATELVGDRVWVSLDWDAGRTGELKRWLGEGRTNGVGKLLYDPDSRRYSYEPGKRQVPWKTKTRSGVHEIDNRLTLEEAQQAIDAHIAKLYPPPDEGHGRLVPENEPHDVLVTTAHKAKGLESQRVRIADDFNRPEEKDNGSLDWDTPTAPNDEALRVAYVAVTRATDILDPGSLSWVFHATGDHDPTQPPETDYRRDFRLSDFAPGDELHFQEEDGTPALGVVTRINPPLLTVLSAGTEPDVAAKRQEISPRQVIRRNGEDRPLLPVASDQELDQAIAENRYGSANPVTPGPSPVPDPAVEQPAAADEQPASAAFSAEVGKLRRRAEALSRKRDEAEARLRALLGSLLPLDDLLVDTRRRVGALHEARSPHEVASAVTTLDEQIHGAHLMLRSELARHDAPAPEAASSGTEPTGYAAAEAGTGVKTGPEPVPGQPADTGHASAASAAFSAEVGKLRRRAEALSRKRDEAEARLRALLGSLLPLDDLLVDTRRRVGALHEARSPHEVASAVTTLDEQIHGAHLMLRSELARHDVRPMDAVGKNVDPAEMEVVGAEAHPSVPDGTVLSEKLTGFRMGTFTLRPARVVVALPHKPSQGTPKEIQKDVDEAERPEQAPARAAERPTAAGEQPAPVPAKEAPVAGQQETALTADAGEREEQGPAGSGRAPEQPHGSKEAAGSTAAPEIELAAVFPAELIEGESARPGDREHAWVVTSADGFEYRLSGTAVGTEHESWNIKRLPEPSPDVMASDAPDARTPRRIMTWLRTESADRTLARERAERHSPLPPEEIPFALEPVVTQLDENYWRVTRYGVEGRVSRFGWGYAATPAEQPAKGTTPSGRGLRWEYAIWQSTSGAIRPPPPKNSAWPPPMTNSAFWARTSAPRRNASRTVPTRAAARRTTRA